MNKVFIYPWKTKSLGASALSSALDVYRLKREGSTFIGSKDKVVINWGCSEVLPEILKCKIVNDPKRVAIASNKLHFFRQVEKSCRVPSFTTNLNEAMDWVRKNTVVVARTKLQARSGAGIVFFDSDTDEFVKAPLYTKYIKKKEEYRVHIAFGKVIDLQQKVLRKTDDEGNPIDPKSVDWRVRSHANGFVFQKNNLEVPRDVIEQAMKAFTASELDFGAIDIVWNEGSQKAYVLEINTAPGIEGSTISSYAEAFRGNL